MASDPGLLVPDPSLVGQIASATPEDQQIVAALEGYRAEAEQARKGGPNSRDEKWAENLDLYWGRYNFADKAAWQSKEVMPEVSSFVDRFAAALKEALVATGSEGFYSVNDPTDKERDLAKAVKRVTDVWLSICGRNQNGQILSFPAVFEEQMKLGAIMACSAVVTWKNDVKDGRVALEAVDPRKVWIDHTYRNLYRLRRVELDRHQLYAMAKQKDKKGKPLFNLPEIVRLLGHLTAEATSEAEALTGSGAHVSSSRAPVILDEYMATVLGPDGTPITERGLFVMANGQFLIRGPEKNPFWHGQDWLVYAPLVTTPLSVYGRSYMEDFGSIAKTFNELTNLILDAVFTSAIKAFAVAPGMLVNPQQAAEGIWPSKMFLLEDGVRPQDFFAQLDMGGLPAEAVSVWQALKREMQEAAGVNEIGMGQFAPNSRTSATEVVETQQSSSALVRSVAQTVETRFLDVALDLMWKTGIQHAKAGDRALKDAAGSDLWPALIGQRRELAARPITFQARGISTLIRKSRMLQALLRVLQIIGSNELLLREFLKVADMQRLVELLFELSDIDLRKLQVSEREALIRQVTEPLGAAQERAGSVKGPASDATKQEAGSIAASMGV